MTDRQVRAAIEDGAASRDDVTAACGAGGDCGSCHHMIEHMIEEATEAVFVSADKLVRHRAA